MIKTTAWKFRTAVLAAAVTTLAFAAYARAEGGLTLEERVQRLERRAEVPPAANCCPTDLQQRLDALEAAIKKPPFGFTINGMLVASYLYDLNDPKDHDNVVGLRAFDKDHNTFSFDLFQLQISRAPGDNGVGFTTKLNFGKTAERMASDWDGDGTIGNVPEENNDVELEEGYITYNFPGLPDFQIKGGKFVTLLGAEVIESPLNPNISRSLAFGFAIPFTHTGLLTSYTFSPQFKAILGVVNGWDNVIDSNDGKSVTGSLAFTPVDQFSMSLNGIYGAEEPHRGDSKRGVIDFIATIKPVDNLAFILNYDYGNETDIVPGTEQWQAFSGIVTYDIPDALQVPIGFALRGEYFDDSNGVRLGNTGYQNDWEVTATFKVVLAEGLMARAEYRYDNAKHPTFLRNVGGLQDQQQTVAAELSYVF